MPGNRDTGGSGQLQDTTAQEPDAVAHTTVSGPMTQAPGPMEHDTGLGPIQDTRPAPGTGTHGTRNEGRGTLTGRTSQETEFRMHVAGNDHATGNDYLKTRIAVATKVVSRQTPAENTRTHTSHTHAHTH